ncbi:MAG: DUF72 domain-containing protein [Kiritimatiellae bacterium]|nr:DUF72 domain-containing protein [Kiritimatiellia bacterium]
MPDALHIGTCSWKFPSWRGVIYSHTAKPDYLREYAQHFDCVEVDQWYWSLFGPDKIALPQPKAVADYAAAVPANFRFGVKLPNALTLTHMPQTAGSASLTPNPNFLSPDLLLTFMQRLEPLHSRLGPLMLQFSYLNLRQMPSQEAFLERLQAFVRHLPEGFIWGIETRNPKYLNPEYFAFLRAHSLAHVFEMGYYMPPIRDVYATCAELLTENIVVRLHGPDWEGMEQRTGQDWSKVVEPRDGDIDALAAVLKDLRGRQRKAWVFVNNHFEGCAPATVRKIERRLAAAG